MNDADFENFLKRARADIPVPDSFKLDVWQRINHAAESSAPEATKFQSFIATITRPWGLIAGIAAMVTLGLLLGATTTPDVKSAKTAYAESISPFVHTRGK